MKSVAIKTLGCKVNTYESDAVIEIFKNVGYKKVSIDSEADVYIINTCTVTNNGDRKSRQEIRRIIRSNPNAIIIVMGCYSQLKPQEIVEIEGVDIVLGTQGRDKVLEHVEKFLEERKPQIEISNIIQQNKFENLNIVSYESQTRAFIKIQEGCNEFCTYCIIPWARGLMRSQDPEKILSLVNKLVEGGVKEIVLTGIHTGGYGEDLEDYDFAKLLQELEKIKSLNRIRISSIEISQLTDQVISIIKNSNKIVNHLHIPIQSGSNQILKEMKRNYTKDEYIKKINEIRNELSSVAITTDLIVGFPGESEELYLETVQTLREISFSEVHVFTYSKRNGTPAAKMENQVPTEIKKKRVNELIKLNEKLANDYIEKFIDQKAMVLVEKQQKNGKYVGYTSNYIKIEFPGDNVKVNELYEIVIKKANHPISQGELIK